MFTYFVLAFVVSLCSTALVRFFALRFRVLDKPDGERKRHSKPVPLLGGVALCAAFFGSLTLLNFLFAGHLPSLRNISDQFGGLLFGSLLLLLVGLADDIRPLSPLIRFISIAIAVVITIIFGVTIDKVTNPTGGALALGLVVGNVVAFVWLMGTIFTVKILDGLDGLATGVVLIGSLIIFFLTQTEKFFQPDVGFLSIVFAGVLTGFLLFNFSPAKIFLGESGGLFIGFTLGVLSIISGSKIATAMLVMAVPIVDLARVIIVRWRRGQPIFQGDREHLHYRLLSYGLSERQVVFLFYAVAILFGLAALYLQSIGKIIALSIATVSLVAFGLFLKNTGDGIKKI